MSTQFLQQLASSTITFLRSIISDPINRSGNWIYYDYPRCFDEHTQVLTRNGWEYIKNVSEEVLTLNPENMELEFQLPTDKIENNYRGKMIKIKNQQVDLLVTPNHKFLVENQRTKKRKILNAEDLNETYRIPRIGVWKGTNSIDYIELDEYKRTWNSGKNYLIKNQYYRKKIRIPIKIWLKLLGWYLSEGSINKYGIQISQTKENIRKKILNQLKPYFKIIKSKDTIFIQDKRLGIYFKQFGLSCSKFIPTNIKQLNSKLLDVLLKSLIETDGWQRSYKYPSFEFYTISEKLADDVQEISIKTGKLANIYTRINNNHSKYPLYRVSIYSSMKNNLRIFKKYLQEVQYNDKVYCLTVPNHFLVVRRNNKIFFAGNSDVTMPRISIIQIGSYERERSVGDEGTLWEITFDIDVWTNSRTQATIGGIKYGGSKLREYLSDKVIAAFLDNRTTLATQYNIIGTVIGTIFTHPYDEELDLYRKTIPVTMTLERIKL